MGGYWEFAGGGVEEGEELQATLHRETMEELGVHIQKFGQVLSSFDYRNGEGERVRQFNVAVELKSTQVILNPLEHDAIEWIEISDIDKIKISLTEEIKNTLRSFTSC